MRVKVFSIFLSLTLALSGCSSNKDSGITEEELEKIIDRVLEEDTKNAEYQSCLDNTFERIRRGELIFGVSGSTDSVYQYCKRFKP